MKNYAAWAAISLSVFSCKAKSESLQVPIATATGTTTQAPAQGDAVERLPEAPPDGKGISANDLAVPVAASGTTKTFDAASLSDLDMRVLVEVPNDAVVVKINDAEARGFLIHLGGVTKGKNGDLESRVATLGVYDELDCISRLGDLRALPGYRELSMRDHGKVGYTVTFEASAGAKATVQKRVGHSRCSSTVGFNCEGYGSNAAIAEQIARICETVRLK